MYQFHRAIPCFGWARLITCIFGVFTGSGTLGAQAPPSNEPILLHEDRDHSELRVEGYEASVECLVNPKGERDYAILGLRATGITDSKTIHLAADDSYFACYSFRDGEILPLFGRLYLPKKIEPGRYTLQLTVEDIKGKKFGQGSLDFSITSEPASPPR